MAKSPSTRQPLPTDPKERFKVVANRRTNNAIIAIQSLGAVAGSADYSYTDGQADKIVEALQTSLNELKAKLAARKRGASVGFSV